MKVLVTGVKGQLGHDVVEELTGRGLEAVGVDIDEMDITDMSSVDKVIKEAAPDAVIHCAAYTAVDAAEENQELTNKYGVMQAPTLVVVENDVAKKYVNASNIQKYVNGR